MKKDWSLLLAKNSLIINVSFPIKSPSTIQRIYDMVVFLGSDYYQFPLSQALPNLLTH